MQKPNTYRDFGIQRNTFDEEVDDSEVFRAERSPLNAELETLEDALNLLGESITDITQVLGPYTKPAREEDSISVYADGYDREAHSQCVNRVYEITTAVASMRRQLDNVSKRLEL